MNKENSLKATCENCGSKNVQYRMEVWINANLVENDLYDYKDIKGNLEYSDTDTSTWCNACKTHCTIVTN